MGNSANIECSYLKNEANTSPVSFTGLFCGLNKNVYEGTSLVAQWLRLGAPKAGGLGLIPGQGTRSHMLAATKS